MKINLTGRHLEITTAIENSVKKQLSKIIKHYPDIESIQVILEVDKNQHKAELIMHFFSQDFAAKASSDDLYKSIVMAKDKMEVMLAKRKAQVKMPKHHKVEVPEALEILTQAEEEQMYLESRV